MVTDASKKCIFLGMIKWNNIQHRLPLFLAAALLLLAGQSCSRYSTDVQEIMVLPVGANALKVATKVTCREENDAAVEYWPQGHEDQKTTTPLSTGKTVHMIVLTNVEAATKYEYRILTGHGNDLKASKVYEFTTNDIPVWMKDIFRVVCPDSSVLPATFAKGYVLLTQREDPGYVCMVNARGKIVWYHQVHNAGYKVARFTANNTVLGLLGGAGYETSYGDQILEVSLTGDTLLCLKKGQGDFKQTIHHEILEEKDHLVTLCVEERVMDLSSIGGSNADTIKGDGILVLDRQGKQVWKWTVFDELDPLKEKNILKEKGDWMHANCITIDKDGNYLVSFYNNGQIWKIDSKTGKRLWTLGKDGSFPIPDSAYFDQAHGIHFDQEGHLTFFDNGVSKKTSRTLTFAIDGQQASLVNNTVLPPEFYNERMGSSYQVTDSTLLTCATKRNSVLLTNLEGRFLWLLKTGMSSYRANFIAADRVQPFINQPGY